MGIDPIDKTLNLEKYSNNSGINLTEPRSRKIKINLTEQNPITKKHSQMHNLGG